MSAGDSRLLDPAVAAHKCANGESARDQQTDYRHGKERLRFWKVRHHQTTQGHGERSGDEPDRGDRSERITRWNRPRGEVEHQVHHAQTEKGNVTEPIKAAFPTRVTAQPLFAVKTKPQSKPGQEP